MPFIVGVGGGQYLHLRPGTQCKHSIVDTALSFINTLSVTYPGPPPPWSLKQCGVETFDKSKKFLEWKDHDNLCRFFFGGEGLEFNYIVYKYIFIFIVCSVHIYFKLRG